MTAESEHGLRVQLATALRDVEMWKMAKVNCAESNQRLRAEVQRLRARDDAARSMLTQLRAALDEDTTFLGAVLRVEMDKWLATGGDRG